MCGPRRRMGRSGRRSIFRYSAFKYSTRITHINCSCRPPAEDMSFFCTRDNEMHSAIETIKFSSKLLVLSYIFLAVFRPRLNSTVQNRLYSQFFIIISFSSFVMALLASCGPIALPFVHDCVIFYK